MNVKKQTIFSIFIFIISILAMMPVVLYNENNVEKVCLTISCVLLIIVAIFTRIIRKKNYFFLFFINIASGIITMIKYGGQGAIITFWNVLLCAMIFNNIGMPEKQHKMIHLFVAAVLSVFLLTCNLKYSYAGVVFSFLNARININIFAILSLANYLHWMCYLSMIKCKKSIRNVAILIITCICIYYIWISNCRSALISIIIFDLLAVLKTKPFQYKTFRMTTIILLVISIIFTYIYIFIYNNESLNQTELFGKSLFTGRQIVWKSAWDTYKRSPIIGNGTSLKLNTIGENKTESAHNTMLSILYTIGIIPAISFIYLLSKKENDSSIRYSRLSQFAFVSSLYVAFFESFYTESRLYLLYLLFLIPMTVENSKIESERKYDT